MASASELSPDALFRVDDMVAVITGGGTGIGAMMAKALALNGASKVYIAGRRKEPLDETAKLSPHGNIIPIVCDVTSISSLQGMVDQVTSEVGYINVLIANSGIMGKSSFRSLSKDHTVEDVHKLAMSQPISDFTDVFNVNTSAVYYSAMAFLPLLDAGNKKSNMPEKVSSQIIATSSIGGFNRQHDAGFAYTASKAATTHLTKSLATYLVRFNIRANALAPGLFPTVLAGPLLEGRDATQVGSFDAAFIPARRTGDELDMAGTILYLTSRAGAYCNGLIFVQDGGRLSVLPASY